MSERQFFTKENERQLIEEGYTVVKGVLTPEACAARRSEVWDFLEEICPGLRRDDPETWTCENWPDNTHGIVQHGGAGQCQATWNVRQDPRLVRAWKEIYGTLWGLDVETLDLVTSMDAVCVLKDPKRGGVHNTRWVHTDQDFRLPGTVGAMRDESKLHPGLRCIQGVANLMRNGPSDGGLYLYPYSHLAHQAFYDRHRPEFKKGTNWFNFSAAWASYLEELERDASPYIPGKEAPFPLRPIKVCADEGDLLLFDSRTHHQNKHPEARAPGTERRVRRMVVYSCMSPRYLQTDASLRIRREAMALLRTTSHWPHLPKLFDDVGRWPKGTMRHLAVRPELTELGRSIAGLSPGEAWPTGVLERRTGRELTLEAMTQRREEKRLQIVEKVTRKPEAPAKGEKAPKRAVQRRKEE